MLETSLALIEEPNHLMNFMYALKAPETKRQWPRRLKMVLDFLQVEGTLEQQAKKFVIQAREKPERVQDKLMQFFSYQIDRATRKEISETTIPNCYKVIKLFCEMNDLLLNWRRYHVCYQKEETPLMIELQL